MWGASELEEEGALSSRGMAGMEGAAAAGVASGRGTGKRGLRWEEDREGETIPAERKEAGPVVGRSLG